MKLVGLLVGLFFLFVRLLYLFGLFWTLYCFVRNRSNPRKPWGLVVPRG